MTTAQLSPAMRQALMRWEPYHGLPYRVRLDTALALSRRGLVWARRNWVTCEQVMREESWQVCSDRSGWQYDFFLNAAGARLRETLIQAVNERARRRAQPGKV